MSDLAIPARQLIDSRNEEFLIALSPRSSPMNELLRQ
jgi:hypothetical protein